MCGITGKIRLDGGFVGQKEIEEMNEAVRHRGPDDSGIYINAKRNVGLGHQRLSIIDLSSLGHQPMNYLNRYWIVFNGEIYNFMEKRELLEKEGYKFRSKTDTEVILALYDKYKEKCVEHLRGMFSFSIYDEKEEIVFCARDRVGKKPFKYYFDGRFFIFGSELKSILTQKEYKKEPDYGAINNYLTYQYCPAPQTGFIGINKLEPAHYIKLSLATGFFEKKKYWELNYGKKLNLPEKEWQERIIGKLRESVGLRMVGDVPLGAFLSGGIDSSAVVALMSQSAGGRIKTFSIGFKEEKFSELKYARMIAEKFQTDHTEFVVEPKAIETLPMLVKHYEEPYADSSALPTYYLSKMTRNHVTVALNGDGGDENFAGYNRYSIMKFSAFYERFIKFNKLTAQPLSRLVAARFNNQFFDRSARFAETLSLPRGERYVNYICYFTNEAKKDICAKQFLEKAAINNSMSLIANHFEFSGSNDSVEQAMYADFVSYLPEDLLVKVDIATMSVGLEGRSPFLDHELLELTAQIPINLKLRGVNNKKYILKKALENILPREIMYRKKMGFGVPLDAWFKGELKNYAYETLLNKEASDRGIFNLTAIKKLLDEHVNTKMGHGNRIWALLTLELWFREYFN